MSFHTVYVPKLSLIRTALVLHDRSRVSCVSLQKRFYGPRERKMGLLAFLRPGVWMNGLRAFQKGFMGNVLGEGFVLGGVFVIGRGEQVKVCQYPTNLVIKVLFHSVSC